MPYLGRNEIAWDEKFRRCLYFFLRDELDGILISESLIESYRAFKEAGKAYPFVEMRELKPRAKIFGPEYPEQRHFIVIFAEDVLTPDAKIHIRFFDSNRTTKENLTFLGAFDLREVFHQRMRYLEDAEFLTLLRSLLKHDFALLIQRDPSVRSRYRFALSHFSREGRLAGSLRGRRSGTVSQVHIQRPVRKRRAVRGYPPAEALRVLRISPYRGGKKNRRTGGESIHGPV